MNAIAGMLYYELQEGVDLDTLIAKVAGYIRQQDRLGAAYGMGEADIANEMRHFFRNSDNQGRRFPPHHHSLY